MSFSNINKNSSLEKEMDILKENNRYLENELAKISDFYSKKFDIWENKKKTMENKIKEMHNKIIDLKKYNDDLKKTKLDLERDFKELKETKIDLERNFEELKETKIDLERDFKELKKDFELEEREHQRTKETNHDLLERKKVIEDQVIGAMKLICFLKDKFHLSDVEINKITDDCFKGNKTPLELLETMKRNLKVGELKFPEPVFKK